MISRHHCHRIRATQGVMFYTLPEAFDNTFDIPKNEDEFFTPAERSLVLDYLLRRTGCVTDPHILSLINDKVGDISNSQANLFAGSAQPSDPVALPVPTAGLPLSDPLHLRSLDPPEQPSNLPPGMGVIEPELDTDATPEDMEVTARGVIDLGISRLISENVFQAAFPLHEH
ncbi:unnamed protein product [Protopolystoma xenopodis]|uniref:Uncharacterized protein n=1 Tax=Protopolystoma xenopodis TaxID=117903 RepID=A0A448X2F8_9PLAT|nr:unnamed protein product [Protopolystoma xenopodis]